ncbi:MAG: phosphatase PAP2 family protein [Gordonia sp. (in: high G+C Gram-positive bacteria)]
MTPPSSRIRLPLGPTSRRLLVVTLAAAAVYVGAVWTSTGQLFDQVLFAMCRGLTAVTTVPAIVVPDTLDTPIFWLVAATAMAVLIVAVVATRPDRVRGLGLGEVARLAVLPAVIPASVYVVETLRDHVLIRPVLHEWISLTTNSAPSGHAAGATALVVVFVLLTPPPCRPWVAAIGGTWATVVEFGLITAGWHRLSDVLLSTILIAGFSVLLPDPYQGVRTRASTVTPRVYWSIPVIASLVVLVYYPTGIALCTTLLIGSVMAATLAAWGVRDNDAADSPLPIADDQRGSHHPEFGDPDPRARTPIG